MRTLLACVVMVCLAVCLTDSALAAVPSSMNVQGRLTDSTGAPLPAGIKTFTFRIFDAETFGAEIWPGGAGEDQPIATDAAGLWTANVGALLGLADAVFADSVRWLEVAVDDGVNPVVTLPRIKLNTSPFVFRAASSQWSDSALESQRSVVADSAVVSASAIHADSTDAITDGGVDFADIGQNGASNGQVMKWAESGWTPAADNTSGGSGGGWTDDGTVVRLDSPTDSVGIGTSTPSKKLEVAGDVLITGKATIGQGHTNTGTAGFAVGESNVVTGKYATVAGGTGNAAGGNGSTVGGGFANNAVNDRSTIGGGESNAGSGAYSTVAGGSNNTASGDSSFVGSGSQNTASELNATVSGGYANTASGEYATVGGGRVNTANAYSATVGGGSANSSTANFSTVGGGNGNDASAASATVGGGNANTANGVFSALTGGSSNTASGSYSAIGGGNDNYSMGNYSTVGGGIHDTASGHSSVVSGGVQNTAGGDSSVVGGGSGNYAGGRLATVSGGRLNRADTAYSTVAGGQLNQASGLESTVGGGNSNLASGVQSTVGGGVIDTASGRRSTIGGGIDNNADGYASAVAGGEQNSSSGDESSVGGGRRNTASGMNATVPGGLRNTASGDYSFAAGRQANAIHNGSFVWGDSTNAHVLSTKPNQFMIRATNGVNLVSDADPADSIEVGERYRDNGIVAWGRVKWDGTPFAEFGVTSIVRNFGGRYTITIDAAATSSLSLVPIAQAEGILRLVVVDVLSANSFEVRIYNTLFSGVDNDFVFMVTAR